MYSITDILGFVDGLADDDVWQGKLACIETNARRIMSNMDILSVDSFEFVLALEGRMTVRYDGIRLELNPHDLLVYAPSLPFQTLAVSDDYRGYCLLLNIYEMMGRYDLSLRASYMRRDLRDSLNSDLMYDSSLLYHLASIAYSPTAKLAQPKVSLSPLETDGMVSLMKRIRHYLHNPSSLQKESLYAACGLLVADLMEKREKVMAIHKVGSRTEEIFSGFLRLLRGNYLQHREIGFYAMSLHVSTTYLSRIVREASGRTVMDFANQTLATEAAYRLKTTSLTVSQIADSLGFADCASFTRFFKRMKGQSPTGYRHS